MNRVQLENIYKANGLYDFKLHTLNDLLKCQGISCEDIKGYSDLSSTNKTMFERFLINYFNVHGIELRLKILPLKVYISDDCLRCNFNYCGRKLWVHISQGGTSWY